MKARIIKKSDIRKFAQKIIEKYPTIAAKKIESPQLIGKDRYNYFFVKDANEIALEHSTSLLPPRNFIFVIREPVYSFIARDGVILDETRSMPKEFQVIFGIHACDINAIRWMDMFYSKDYKDPEYWSKRERTLLVGMSCVPSDNCFCESWGMDSVEIGFDLFLWDIGDEYFVKVQSMQGDKLTQLANELFYDADDVKFEKMIQAVNEKRKLFKRHVDTSNFQQLLSLTWDKEVHKKWGDMCFGCGPCVFVCPTCFCYNLVEEVQLTDINRGEKVKRQDACMLFEYSLIAGGHNFRPTPVERLRYRHYCKTKFTYDRYGWASCVGCGRCIDACPANIDIVKFMQDVREGIL